ncbi:hypothetical protein Plhal304r1_c035g0109291 [Plasmopara halstedii]
MVLYKARLVGKTNRAYQTELNSKLILRWLTETQCKMLCGICLQYGTTGCRHHRFSIVLSDRVFMKVLQGDMELFEASRVS